MDILYSQLQKRNTDPLSIKQAVTSFENEILKIRDDIDNITTEEENTAKRRWEDMYITRNVAAKEVCDIIIHHSKETFVFSSHLLASTLLDHHFFPSSKRNFQKIFFLLLYSPTHFLTKLSLKLNYK